MDIGAMINEYLRDCITQVLQQASDFISQILFEPREMPDFFKKVYLVFLGIGVMIMTIIIAFRLVEYMLDVSQNQTQATVWEIIVKTIKASFMIVAAPALLTLIVGQVVYPLGSYIFSSIATDLSTVTANYITSMGGLFTKEDSFVFILMVLFITITILVQTLLLAGVTSILASTFEWYNFMLLIGFCCLLIKGPSVLRSMWYTTGTSRTAVSGGKLATRMLMMKGGF